MRKFTTLMGEPRIRNVSEPANRVSRIDCQERSGTAVIIAPSGGFLMLSMQSERD
jgi:hypothetical protein